MKVGFFAGSFDPFTNGHLYVVKKALEQFDEIVVGIGINPDKTRRFDKFEMKNAIEKVFSREDINNVKVVVYDGYTVNEAAKHNAKALVRGFRSDDELTKEQELAAINKQLSGIETVFIEAGDMKDISSTFVYKKIILDENYIDYVPIDIYNAIKK